MAEINRVTELDLIDKLLYRFLIIPITRKRLLEREAQFAWIYRQDFPDWGRGRDDAHEPDQILHDPRPDGRHLRSDRHAFAVEPQEVCLGAGPSHELRWRQPRRLLGDHGLRPRSARRRPADKADFVGQVKWLHGYLSELPAPKSIRSRSTRPGPTAASAVQRSLRRVPCQRADRHGRMPLAEVGTDRGRLDSWNKGAAIKANQVVKEMGLERRGLVEEDLSGYIVPFLDGIWLKAPYLHNGSVPTLRDLLEPAAERPTVFWRGYDVYDPIKVGFVTDTPEAQRIGTRLDTRSKGGGNQGHEFGSQLSAADKEALVEYLKTL
jgi:hypothetical protein